VVINIEDNRVNKFKIYPQPNTTIVFNDFNDLNLLDLSLFSQFSSMGELSYSTDPLTILLPDGQKLVFPTVPDLMSISAANFGFSSSHFDDDGTSSSSSNPFAGNSERSRVLTASLFALLGLFALLTFLSFYYCRAWFLKKFQDQTKRKIAEMFQALPPRPLPRKLRIHPDEDLELGDRRYSSCSSLSSSSLSGHSSIAVPERIVIETDEERGSSDVSSSSFSAHGSTNPDENALDPVALMMSFYSVSSSVGSSSQSSRDPDYRPFEFDSEISCSSVSSSSADLPTENDRDGVHSDVTCTTSISSSSRSDHNESSEDDEEEDDENDLLSSAAVLPAPLEEILAAPREEVPPVGGAVVVTSLSEWDDLPIFRRQVAFRSRDMWNPDEDDEDEDSDGDSIDSQDDLTRLHRPRRISQKNDENDEPIDVQRRRKFSRRLSKALEAALASPAALRPRALKRQADWREEEENDENDPDDEDDGDDNSFGSIDSDDVLYEEAETFERRNNSQRDLLAPPTPSPAPTPPPMPLEQQPSLDDFSRTIVQPLPSSPSQDIQDQQEAPPPDTPEEDGWVGAAAGRYSEKLHSLKQVVDRHRSFIMDVEAELSASSEEEEEEEERGSKDPNNPLGLLKKSRKGVLLEKRRDRRRSSLLNESAATDDPRLAAAKNEAEPIKNEEENDRPEPAATDEPDDDEAAKQPQMLRPPDELQQEPVAVLHQLSPAPAPALDSPQQSAVPSPPEKSPPSAHPTPAWAVDPVASELPDNEPPVYQELSQHHASPSLLLKAPPSRTVLASSARSFRKHWDFSDEEDEAEDEEAGEDRDEDDDDDDDDSIASSKFLT
jgi:hypothetical protein